MSSIQFWTEKIPTGYPADIQRIEESCLDGTGFISLVIGCKWTLTSAFPLIGQWYMTQEKETIWNWLRPEIIHPVWFWTQGLFRILH